MRLRDFDYPLPAELVAQHPASPRDAARLMVVDRRTGEITHRVFTDLPQYLTPADVLVLNDTRVIPARLRAKRPTGGAVEVLLLRPLGDLTWEALVRPGRRVRAGTRLIIMPQVTGEVVEARPDGVRVIVFATDRPLLEVAREVGEMPLPPYIHESLHQAEDYQTVYAATEGAVAAPTAGLHFTPELLGQIRAAGVRIASLTMHIGLGTFRAVTAEQIEVHHMDAEWFEIGERTAEVITAGRASGGRTVVVGTSAVRALETAAGQDGVVHPASGWSELFIYPGFNFAVTGALVTNFHLPKTTLLMLVCAFAGREVILRAYQEAVRAGYRFYSFGDAMLIL